jgi:hypothetical protein
VLSRCWEFIDSSACSDEGDTPPHDENSVWDPDGSILKAHFERAKEIWEALLPGPGEYEFDFQWDDDIDVLGHTTDLGALDVYIEINPNVDWYADPTPENDDEFSIGQQLFYSDLQPDRQMRLFAGTPPPEELEVGYRKVGDFDAGPGLSGRKPLEGPDLLSTVLHEIGHVLGVSGEEPGEYNIHPQHIGGWANVLVVEDDDSGHLGDAADLAPLLMADYGSVVGLRRFPSATDVLVIAEDQGITNVHLERVGRIPLIGESGLWTESYAWMGGRVPDTIQEVYVSHSGTVVLDTDVQLRSLLIRDGSRVQVGPHRPAADAIIGDPSSLSTTPGSLVRFNRFDSGPSAARVANFNGSVAIGFDTESSAPVDATLVLDPLSSVSMWNVREQLAIGDERTTSTLVVTGGAKVTSASGRIGTDFNGGGEGRVFMTGADSRSTIGGVLDARNGSLNVSGSGLPHTGSASLGADEGRMEALVQGGSWQVDGNLNIGPSLESGSGQGQLTIQEQGGVSVSGNLTVHGTSTAGSQAD